MLVEFRVKNFKSIRDEQAFSMAAGHDKKLYPTHVIPGDGKIVPDLLKSAAIYGANASGKSNFVEAIGSFQALLKSESHILPYIPGFRPADEKQQDSEFEITIAEDGVRYQYGVSLLDNVVDEEWLFVYKSAKPQKWFHRKRVNIAANEYAYSMSSYLEGPKEEWKTLTPPSGLFLKRGSFLNSSQLADVYNKILKNLSPRVNEGYRHDKLERLRDGDTKQKVLGFLKAADFNIVDLYIAIRTRLFSSLAVNNDRIEESSDLVFVHSSNGVRTEFGVNEESHGTKRFLDLSFDVLDALSNGDVLIIDELERSLHPNLVRYIVDMFNSESNTVGAQLVFTTHNPMLLDTNVLRRDQIWFIEKGVDGASLLYPLTDFSPRKDTSLSKKYLSGAFGAVPYLTKLNINEDSSNAPE